MRSMIVHIIVSFADLMPSDAYLSPLTNDVDTTLMPTGRFITVQDAAPYLATG
jgi:hypothetical protein